MPSRDTAPTFFDDVLREVLAAAAKVFERPVQAHENFFDLGGDSITATELLLLLEHALGAEPDITELMSAQDMTAFAAALAVPGAQPGQAGGPPGGQLAPAERASR